MTDSGALSAPLEGGCACGAVRFVADVVPKAIAYCHCTLCCRQSAAPSVAWACFKAAEVRFTKGAPKRWRSSKWAEREFCPDCGTPLTFRFMQGGEPRVDVTVLSFDQAREMAPRAHVFTEDGMPWHVIGDALPRLPAAGPGYSPDGFGAVD